MLCSGSYAKFRQHLPAVLLIHVSAINREDVYSENNREALTKFCIGFEAEHMGKRTLACPWITFDNLKESRL